MEYNNLDSGVLFKNDKKGDNPNAPDYRGKINVAGTDYWLSAWIKQSKIGTKYMSLSVQEKDYVQKDVPVDDSDLAPF